MKFVVVGLVVVAVFVVAMKALGALLSPKAPRGTHEATAVETPNGFMATTAEGDSVFMSGFTIITPIVKTIPFENVN